MEGINWQSGWPEQQGWFDCLIDGANEDRLQHWICPMAGRHHWKNIDGDYVEALHSVQWFGNAELTP